MDGFKRGVARVIAAGLGLSLAWGTTAVAFAEGSSDSGSASSLPAGEYANSQYGGQNGASTGDTRLYIVGKQNDLTTDEGSTDEQIKVSIPVAIHYVADNEGNLYGPADNNVMLVNHTTTGAVHVSKIGVTASTGVTIVNGAGNANTNDKVALTMTPVRGTLAESGGTKTFSAAENGTGQADQLGSYANAAKDPTYKNDWDIAQTNGAVALNELTGKIGGFGTIDPATDYQVGTVNWTVRSGTRAAADTKDTSVTIRFRTNGGFVMDGRSLDQQVVPVLDSAALPNQVALSDNVLSTALISGTGVLGKRVIVGGGETTVSFKEWNTKADGQGQTVATIADLESGATAASLAGKTFVLYAIYNTAS